jgi:hypothetical protein
MFQCLRGVVCETMDLSATERTSRQQTLLDNGHFKKMKERVH